jgi:chromosomal replication initiation ATPase DnaA
MGKGADATKAKQKNQDDFMEDSEAVNLAADWSDISQGLRKDLGHQLHSQWIKPIQVGGIDKQTGTLDLFLPTEFSANWVKDRFADRLSLAWKIACSEVRHVNIQVHPGRRQVADLRLPSNGRRPANDGADSSMMAISADHDNAKSGVIEVELAKSDGTTQDFAMAADGTMTKVVANQDEDQDGQDEDAD